MRPLVLACCAMLACSPAHAQGPDTRLTPTDPPRTHPINLATALKLAHARPIDVQVAARQVEVAGAQYDRSKYTWLPSVYVGGDYFKHEGSVQNFQGQVLNASRSSVMGGFGANAGFASTVPRLSGG